MVKLNLITLNLFNEARKQSYADMKKFRENYQEAVRQYAGQRYGVSSMAKTAERNPMNKTRQLADTYMKNLVTHNPQMRNEAKDAALAWQADDLEMLNNQTIEKMRLSDALNDAVFDSIFGMGVVKVGLRPTGKKQDLHGEPVDPMEIFAGSISPNDLCISMNSTDLESLDFVGNRYFLTREEVKQRFNRTIESADSDQSEMRPEPRVSGVKMNPDKSMYNRVSIWEYYLLREEKIITIIENETEPLEIVDWEGPRGGPYRFLRMGRIAHELLPTPIGQELFDLAHLIGNLMSKLGVRAADLKEIPIYEDGAEDDAKRMREANDGDWTRVRDITKTGTMKFAGNTSELMGTLVFCLQRYNELGGNLDALAGLKPQSETLGQDEMLTATANAMIDRLRIEVLAFVKEIVSQIAWYTFNDPEVNFTGIRERHSVETIPITFNNDTKQGDYHDYMFDIKPFSLTPLSPEQEMARMLMTLDRVIMPMAPLAQQAGLIPNVEEFSRQWAKLSQIPFRRIWKYMEPVMQQAAQPDSGIGRPPTTHRINERISRPGNTAGAEEAALMQGANNQSSGKMVKTGTGG